MTKPGLTALEALDRFAELAPDDDLSTWWMKQKESRDFWAERADGRQCAADENFLVRIRGVVKAMRATASAPPAAPVCNGSCGRRIVPGNVDSGYICGEPAGDTPRRCPPPPATSVERELLGLLRETVPTAPPSHLADDWTDRRDRALARYAALPAASTELAALKAETRRLMAERDAAKNEAEHLRKRLIFITDNAPPGVEMWIRSRTESDPTSTSTELADLKAENERLRARANALESAAKNAVEVMEMQEKRESGEFHLSSKAFLAFWIEAKSRVRLAARTAPARTEGKEKT